MRKKRLCIVLLLCMFFLCACGKPKEKDEAADLEFPGVTWDMTPDDVLEAFQTAKEDALLYEENNATTSFGIADIELFGLKAERVFFNFIDFSSFDQMPQQGKGKYQLCRIQAYYPQDADLKPVKEKAEQAYGATVSEYYPFNGWMDPENEKTMKLEPWKETESVQYWGSSILGDVLSEKDIETYQKNWQYCRDGLNEENWDFFKDHARMVSVIFSDQEAEGGKGMEWDAHNLAVYNVLSSQT